MKKNGKNFLLNLKTNNFEAGTWDPNYYLGFSKKKSLKNFAQILKLSECAKKTDKYYLNPIEYKNILSERHLIYNIEDSVRTKKRYFCVEEQTLLLGTVRAYLGNIIVTPMASWIGQKKGFVFPINSEFLAIKPKDNLVYYWWAYFNSNFFLKNLPAGTGGTRPRLKREYLENMTVNVLEIKKRQKINNLLKHKAKKDWVRYLSTKDILNRMF